MLDRKSDRGKPDQSAARRNYPRNCWWVAGTCEEVGRKPVGRWILDQPVVLYRRETGEAVALEDRCAHRWAPLSLGTVSGDDIICPYHGFRYNGNGKCVSVPTQSLIPKKAQVKTYPVLERSPFIWIWTGDPDKVKDAEEPPALPWATDPSWIVARGTYLLEANYLTLKENVLDLTHFAFVHGNTFQVMDYLNPPTVETDGTRVTYRQEFANTPLPALYGIPTGIGVEKPATRVNSGSFVTPAMQEATVLVLDPTPEAGARDCFEVKVAHLTTPASTSRTHYWWARGQDFGHRPGAVEDITALVEKTFREDKDVLEAIQTVIDLDARHRDAPEVSVKADEAGLRMRRIVDQMVAAEL